MSTQKRIKLRAKRRAFRVRNKLRQRGNGLFRLSVFRSLNQIYAQIIDDESQKTVASYSSLLLKDSKGDKKDIAKMVGLELGKLAQEASIGSVVFDRGSYLYHGRLKALADGLKEGGVKI